MKKINHRGLDAIARSLGVRSLQEALEADKQEKEAAEKPMAVKTTEDGKSS